MSIGDREPRRLAGLFGGRTVNDGPAAGVIGGSLPSAGLVMSDVRRSCQSRPTTQNWL